MSRCVCCNAVLEYEWLDLKPDGTDEDLCNRCHNVVDNIDHVDDDCYAFEELTGR